VVVDSTASIDLRCKLLSGSDASRTIIASTRRAPQSKLAAIALAGAQTIVCRERKGLVSVRDLMRRLAKRGILYVLIEGGSKLITSTVEAEVVDKVAFFYAPRIIGGEDAPSVVEGAGERRLKDALAVRDTSVRRFGSDVLIEGYVVKPKGRR
jgi:diaminohydroxyphosphoribosylaminopyrimidine deaminase/5-amino-6-(5-phosphoribosylamino)uracil reductase